MNDLAASRRDTRSWADEVEEELFVEEMIVSSDTRLNCFASYKLRDLKETEEEEEMEPVVIEKKVGIVEALRAGIMNVVSILEENAIEIDLAMEMAQETEAVVVVKNTVSIFEDNIMDIDLGAEMAEADTAFYYDESVSFDTLAAAR